jgi:hypothetical protein
MTQYMWETGYELVPAQQARFGELRKVYERQSPLHKAEEPGRTAPLTAPAVFRPIAVETPGGGRVRDKRDPPPSDLVSVRGVNGPVQLHKFAAQAWSALVNAARAEGLREPLLLPVSGYRSSARQARLYQQALKSYHTPEEARRWVAPPGHSAHRSGRAIDFYLGGRNASWNVANLRRLPAYRWLAANAERFGFYPYDAEPWHWEYNPPAANREPVVTDPWSSEVGAAGVRVGRHEVANVPVLARHRGASPALVLRWNDMAAMPAEVDVVVHLHGYSQAGPTLLGDIERYSGLDLVPVDGATGRGRSRPTLTILPRGDFSGAKNASGLLIATFPALDGSDGRPDGLTRLVQFSLEQFATVTGSAVPRAGRLILTAHSGGGRPLLRMLRHHDPDEVHVFDALYWDARALADWARRHARQDRQALAGPGATGARRGALRIFYRAPTRRFSRELLRQILPDIQAGLADWYRIEASSLGHWDIPRTYGWRILADASADVPRTGRDLAGRRPRQAGEFMQDVHSGRLPEVSLEGTLPGGLPDAVSALAGSVRGMAEGAAALAGGERNASRLTDIVFHARHPERGGRPIARGETKQAREWVWIRDNLIQPLLRHMGSAPAAAPQAPPVTAAGSPSVSHFLKKRPRDPERWRLLASMLDRYRGDIPLEFLLGWIAVESDGCIDVITHPENERGFFQIMPSESRAMKFDHERLTTDPDYSVQAGIQLVRHYANLARTRYPWATPGSDLFWRLVKLQHAMGGWLTSQLIASIQKSNLSITWEAIKRYEVTEGRRLYRLLNPSDPAKLGRFGRNVDEVFQRGHRLAATLRR